MAAASLHFLLLLAVPSLLLFSAFPSLSYADEGRDLQFIRDICRKTKDPEFCFAILSTNPDSRGKNFHDLTALSINLANARGVAAREYISDAQKRTTEPVLKKVLEECFGDYDDGVVYDTAAALESFTKFQFPDAVLFISGAVSATQYCDEASASHDNVLKEVNGVTMRYLTVAMGLAQAFL